MHVAWPKLPSDLQFGRRIILSSGQIRKQKDRAKRKRPVLKNVYAIYTQEVYNALVECKRAAKEKKKRKGKKQGFKCTQEVSSSEDEDEDNVESASEDGGVEIEDCIVVKQ